MKLFKNFPIEIDISIDPPLFKRNRKDNDEDCGCECCFSFKEFADFKDGNARKLTPIGSFLILIEEDISEWVDIEKVIYSDKHTIVLWSDGDKTVVKAQNDEPFDEEKGLAMAIIKKLCGNTGRYNELFKEYCNE